MNFEEIKELAKQYNVEIEQKGSQVCYVKSKGNTWYFYLSDLPNDINERSNIFLYHKCLSKSKEHYHTQRKFSLLYQLFDSVSSHDQHMFQQRKKSRMELLFEKINNERENQPNKGNLHSKKSKNKHRNIDKMSNKVCWFYILLTQYIIVILKNVERYPLNIIINYNIIYI